MALVSLAKNDYKKLFKIIIKKSVVQFPFMYQFKINNQSKNEIQKKVNAEFKSGTCSGSRFELLSHCLHSFIYKKVWLRVLVLNSRILGTIQLICQR